MTSRFVLVGLILLLALSLTTGCGIATPSVPTVTHTWPIQSNTPFPTITLTPTETSTPTPTSTDTLTPTSTPDLVKQGLELPGVARVVDFGDSMVAFGDYSDIPVYEYDIGTGRWEKFEREIGPLLTRNITIPEWMFAPISLEESQYLRFTDGMGGLLPYGYIGFTRRDDAGELYIIQEWIGDRPDIMQEEWIVLLFHGRLRGVISDRRETSVGDFEYAILEIPIEKIDRVTGERVWTGDSQYDEFYMYTYATPDIYAVEGKNINEVDIRRISVNKLMEVVMSLPVGSSIVFGVPCKPKEHGIKSYLKAIYEGELFETYGHGLAVIIYIDSSYLR